MNQSDDNPFGHSIPLDVQFASKLLSATTIDDNNATIDTNCFGLISAAKLDCLCRMCYEYTIDKSFSRIKYLRIRSSILDEWNSNDCIKPLNLNVRDFDRIFAGLLSVCQCIARHFPKPNFVANNFDQLRESIQKHSQMPEPIFDLIYEKFLHSTTTLNSEKDLKPNIIPFVQWDWIATGYRLISIRWNLSLAISDLLTPKIMEPFVRFEFIYGSGSTIKQQKRIIFECRIKQFHQLRFTVAWLLKEMAKLKSNKILSN
ncbi:regulation of RNA metabolic process [Dermatophagoides pteronyssinus]|uniref:Regulation of RNA metabolic process n=1 Tax=Dermatophagoides pteronyssinus TaxID=6956 RepID=A0ABQ8JDG0_DERPT|nr:regulation of RNA metabolic process [Dermatophagoides pteronyssinus]